MGMIPNAELRASQFPFADAATTLFGSYAALSIALCAVVSGLGALNGCVLLQGQIVFAAARDELFPRRFAKLSKHDVPVAGQILSSSLVSLFLLMTIEPTLLKQFNNIALLAALMTLATYFATMIAELKFILQSKQSWHRILTRSSLYISVLAAVYSIWMIASFELSFLLTGVGLLLAAVPIYFFVLAKKGDK